MTLVTVFAVFGCKWGRRGQILLSSISHTEEM